MQTGIASAKRKYKQSCFIVPTYFVEYSEEHEIRNHSWEFWSKGMAQGYLEWTHDIVYHSNIKSLIYFI